MKHAPIATLLIALSFGLMLPACVGGDETLDQQVRSTERSQLTADEIRSAEIAGSAYDIIQRLRPAWLHRRGGQPIRVYLDGRPYGASEQSLRNIPASGVWFMERLDGPQATARFGRGHAGGAIVIESN